MYSTALNSWPNKEDKKRLKPVFRQISSLLFHCLSVVDLVKCWVGWQIQPLSIHTKLMCEYSGSRDAMRFSQGILEPYEVVRSTKKLLGEPIGAISRVGLNPFWARNPAPKVISVDFIVFSFCENMVFLLALLFCRTTSVVVKQSLFDSHRRS